MTPEQIAAAWAQAYGAPAASSYQAPGTTDYNNLSAGIGQDVLSHMQNTQMWAPFDNTGAAGQWGYEGGNSPTDPSRVVYHPQGQGVGEQYPTFDPVTGAFTGYQTGSKVQSYASGIASVAGAGLGFGLIGAAAGGAGAAAAGGGAQAAGTGAGVTGFGDAGTMYAGGSAADAGTLGGGYSLAGGGTAAMGAGAAGAAGGGGDAAAGAGAAGSGGGGGVPPPANPYLSSGGGSGMGSLFNPDGSLNYGALAGLGASGLGALAGSQGQQKTSTATQNLPGYLQGPVAGDLLPRTQGLLGSQMPQAQAAGNQMLSVGSGLLGQTAPTTATNPYLSSVADDMQRRTQLMLGQNNLAIQGNSVATGGLGGSRQGVAQGIAAGQAADNLQGNVASLYGNAYTGDQNRLLQQQTLGAGLMSQGMSTPWSPINQATQTYNPFTGFGTSTATQQTGGGAVGALGGALGTMQMGHVAGWW